MNNSLTVGSFAGAGSFQCEECGYTLTLAGSDALTTCPECGGGAFIRASLFSGSTSADTEHTGLASGARAGACSRLIEPASPEHAAQLARARRELVQPGEYLCYQDGGELRTVALSREWTRIGRSLAADVRFDDPTVSRRHALIVRQPDGVRLLDDRSLNGVFLNGARVDGKVLQDGDEIIVGRYRLSFLSVPAVAGAQPAPAVAEGS